MLRSTQFSARQILLRRSRFCSTFRPMGFFDLLGCLDCRHRWQMGLELLRKRLHFSPHISLWLQSIVSSAHLRNRLDNPLLGNLSETHDCLQRLSRVRSFCTIAESSFAPTGATLGMIACGSPSLCFSDTAGCDAVVHYHLCQVAVCPVVGRQHEQQESHLQSFRRRPRQIGRRHPVAHGT